VQTSVARQAARISCDK